MIDRHCTINGVMFVGLVCLTSNHMFGSGDFWDTSPSWFLKILKLPWFYSGNFKIFKNALRQFIPNRPPKNVITSINIFLFNDKSPYNLGKTEEKVNSISFIFNPSFL